MAETYWDPANLLQITGLDNPLEVQCLGRVGGRENSRCRQILSGSDATVALAMIKKMAANPPTKVTLRNLEALAKLCLCRDTHFSQWQQVAQRWRPVTVKAARQYERVTMPNGNGPSDRIRTDTPLTERRRCCEIPEIGYDTLMLPEQLQSRLRANEDKKSRAEAVANGLRSELSTAHTARSIAEDELSKVKEELAQVSSQRSQLEAELDQANEKSAWLANQYQTAFSQLEETRAADCARLAKMAQLVENAKSDRETLKARVSALDEEVALVQESLDEEKAKSKALRCSAAQLEQRFIAARNANTIGDSLIAAEKAKTRAVQGAKDDLERRLSEAESEIATTRRGLEQEKTRTTALQESQKEYHPRMTDRFFERDRLLTDQRKSKEALQDTIHHREQRLQEVNAEAESLLHKERTKTKVLSDIRNELRNRLSEVRASAAAEGQKYSEEIQALRKEHKTALDKINALQKDLDKAKAHQSALERELSESRDTVKALQNFNDQLSTNLAALEHNINARRARNWRARLRSFFHPQKPARASNGTTPPVTTPPVTTISWIPPD